MSLLTYMPCLCLQDSIEAQIQRMLADHRPCHYATTDSDGQDVWVPRHTPCWFESSSGKLIVDLTSGAKCEIYTPLVTSALRHSKSRCLTCNQTVPDCLVRVSGEHIIIAVPRQLITAVTSCRAAGTAQRARQAAAGQPGQRSGHGGARSGAACPAGLPAAPELAALPCAGAGPEQRPQNRRATPFLQGPCLCFTGCVPSKL